MLNSNKFIELSKVKFKMPDEKAISSIIDSFDIGLVYYLASRVCFNIGWV